MTQCSLSPDKMLQHIILSCDINTLSINKHFLKEAYREAAQSNDLSTQNGAVLVTDGEIVARGFNDIQAPVRALPERYEKDKKLFYTTHAEESAIMSALRSEEFVSPDRTILYTPWFSCAGCCRIIINSGIKLVVGHKQMFEKTPPRWIESIYHSFNMFKDAGVQCYLYDGKIFQDGDLWVRMNGEIWCP